MQNEFTRTFAEFIESEDFPCVGAKSALATSSITFFEGDRIDRPMDDLPLYKALSNFGKQLEEDASVLQSFVAGFDGPRTLTEREFEEALWDRLQCLHNLDAAQGIDWAEDVSSDPDSPHFSMSVAGAPYFVIGLHPGASRTARRFDRPILVFNSHSQFEALRSDGRYKKMKSVIRQRDRELDGEINPMLTDHGDQSETRQYSGRVLPENWECPIEVQEPAA